MNQPMIVEGRIIRVSPSQASQDNLEVLQGIPMETAQKKITQIRAGGEMAEQNQPFPESRQCQDCCWLFLFIATVVITLGLGFVNSTKLLAAMTHHKDAFSDGIEFPAQKPLMAAVMAGACSSIVAAFLYVQLARFAAGCVVWTSLLFTPVLMMVIGAAICLTGQLVALVTGGLMFLVGLLMLFCVFCCYRHLIPFMIKMTEVVAEVIQEHPCLLFVGIIGAGLGFVWTVVVQLSFSAMYMENEELLKSSDKNIKYVITFVCTLIFVWGAGVCTNICHVTYCGVFGGWYYKKDASLGSAFKVAMTTSLGSICFGSLLVAFVRALEAVARQCRGDAQEEGNQVACVIACVLECIISCIGDTLEYFNEWSYVQCAVRGTSFITSAKITYALCTCSNCQYIMSDLLLNSLVTMGGCLCGLVGGVSGAAVGFVLDGTVAATWGGILGLIIGCFAGFAALSIIGSGVKTILACWADDPTMLKESNPEIAREFEMRIRGKMN